MATLRQFLKRSGFDHVSGRIVVQRRVEDDRYRTRVEGRFIGWDDPVLDEEFDEGYGAAGCPDYVAEDALCYYFPEQYDGATAPCRVCKDLSVYVGIEAEIKEATPYPGGG